MAKTPLGIELPSPLQRIHSLAQLSVRPQRYAFIIDTRVSKKTLLGIVSFNTSIWGGFFNLMVPCTRSSLSQDYHEALLRYDPDRIIFCGRFSKSFQTKLLEQVEPFSAIQWKAIQGAQDREVRCRPIDTDKLYYRQVERLLSQDSSNIRLPKLAKGHPLHFYATAQFGLLSKDELAFAKEDLKGKEISFAKNDSLNTYLGKHSEILGLMYPLRLSRTYLQSSYQMGGDSDAVIVLSSQGLDVDGFCALNNSRMNAGAFGEPNHAGFLFLPVDALRSRKNLLALAKWCSEKHESGRITLLGPKSIERKLRGLKKRLSPLLSPQFNSIECSTQASYWLATQMVEESHAEELSWLGNSTRVRALRPSFDQSWMSRHDTWIVECDISDPATDIQSYFPPKKPGRNKLLNYTTNKGRLVSSILGDRWRTFQDRLCFQCNSAMQFAHLTLPSADEILTSVLKTSGFSVNHSDKCRYINASRVMLEEAGCITKLQEKPYRKLFDSMSNNKPLTEAQMVSTIGQSGGRQIELASILPSLLRTGCLLRGAFCRCPACGLKNWYPIEDFGEYVRCFGCTTQYQMPLVIDYAYRLSSLLGTGIEQGSLSVLLTEKLLRRMGRKTSYSVPGIVAGNAIGKKFDIDIALSCDGHLVLAECKTLDKVETTASLSNVISQLETDFRLAKKVGASVFCISTLAQTAPSRLADFVRRKNKHGYLPFSILLTCTDLERGFLSRSCVLPKKQSNSQEIPIHIEELLVRGIAHGFSPSP